MINATASSEAVSVSMRKRGFTRRRITNSARLWRHAWSGRRDSQLCSARSSLRGNRTCLVPIENDDGASISTRSPRADEIDFIPDESMFREQEHSARGRHLMYWRFASIFLYSFCIFL